MRAYKFIVAMHADYGSLGLRPKWYPTGDPLGGMAAAHDILEHFANDDGSTEGELMALGASLFVRGDGGYSTRYRPYDEVRDPAGDIPMVWGYHLEREGARGIRVPPRTLDDDARARAMAIMDYARPELNAQWESTAPHEEERGRMAGWIAHGYMKAQRRYSRVIGGACALASTFMEIERECDGLLKGAAEGMVITVYVNVMRSDARVTLDYPDDSFA